MKSLLLAISLLAAQGCLPERPEPVPPPAAASSSDERAMQTLTDLGITPEIMLRLVRDHLASAVQSDEPGQPIPAQTEEAPPAEPAPAERPTDTPALLAQAPVTALEPPAPGAPAEETAAMPALPPPPPPATEPPMAVVPEQHAAATTTIVLQQPVIIQHTQDFYAPLNSYGAWITLPAHGRVWQPAVTVVNAEWRPYFQGGRWIYTDCGWYWQSDYSWGWAVFHYGRWCYVDRHRWVWIPDTVWAPAWVSWRRSETHCGWAPLPPGTTFRMGVGFSVGNDAQFDVQFGLSSRHYTFVPNNRMRESSLVSVIVHHDHVQTVYQNSRHIDNAYHWNQEYRRVHNKGPTDYNAIDRAHRPVARPIRFVPPPTAPVEPPVATPRMPSPKITPVEPPVTTPRRPPPKTTPVEPPVTTPRMPPPKITPVEPPVT
ncbi:MAG: hypothetical protein FJ222_11700, partial [Lentisphaerae bacterium]|nr:hypothetical protein [Lentisphaerota bacterium]